jgi:hypothetical protein
LAERQFKGDCAVLMGTVMGHSRESGQALVLVTLAMFAMFGLVGLAVDFGWAYYVEKTAQAAADAGALAAVKRAVDANPSMWTCGSGVDCAATPVDCPSGATGMLASACVYAAQNGFTPATNSRQRVTVQASDATTPPTVQACNTPGNRGCSTAGCTTVNLRHPPTAPCVDTVFWVTVRVSQTVPQLFSAIMGNPTGLVSARATAAVARTEMIGSLVLTNRENEVPWNTPADQGKDLHVQGSGTLNVPGGIILASNANPAGFAGGGGSVTAPFTYVRVGGGVQLQGSSTWTAPPANRPDSAMFRDPFEGRGQPPINPMVNPIPVPQNNSGRAFLSSTVCPGNVCAPGIYYAADANGNATGGVIEIPSGSDLRFSGSSPGYTNFGDWIMFGGMNIGQATARFGPGRYVLAGVNASGGGSGPPPVFDNDNRAALLNYNTTGTDPGRIFILTAPGTNSGYTTDLNTAISRINSQTGANVSALQSLVFSSASIQAGNNAASQVNLTGLNPASVNLPGSLQNFAPVVLWQDQQNSTVEYTASGRIDTSCGLATFNNPCVGSQASSPSPELRIWSTPNTTYDGAIYQPRGAWTIFNASGTYTTSIQVVSGAMKVQGTPNLTLLSPSVPITSFTPALIE